MLCQKSQVSNYLHCHINEIQVFLTVIGVSAFADHYEAEHHLYTIVVSVHVCLLIVVLSVYLTVVIMMIKICRIRRYKLSKLNNV